MVIPLGIKYIHEEGRAIANNQNFSATREEIFAEP